MTMTRRAALAGLATFAAGPAAAQGARNAAERDVEGFSSGGRTITLERFDPPGVSPAARRPAVLLLHGSDGPGPRYRSAAQALSRGGFRVFNVHYLDRTGQARANYASIPGNLPLWTDTVRDALSYVSAEPGVAAGRIGVLGISLGGGIALAAAAQDPRIRALVDYFGFVPSNLSPAAALPPTLVLHGAEDRVVPVSNARLLEQRLAARGVPHEVVIYPGQGHGFTGEAQTDAARRIAAFFGRTLGGVG